MIWNDGVRKTVFAALSLSALFVRQAACASLSSGDAGSLPAAYNEWLGKYGSYYSRSAYMGQNDQVALHWNIDEANSELDLALAVSGATGWVAFGVSETGGMKGADMVWYLADNNTLVDGYSLDYTAPSEDACQNWFLVEESGLSPVVDSQDEMIIVRMRRALKTGDEQDIPIEPVDGIIGLQHMVLAAWGDSAQLSYHGPNAASSRVRFFDESAVTTTVEVGDGPPVEPKNNGERTVSIDLRVGNYVIPPVETTYADFCWNSTELMELGLLDDTNKTHVIKFEFLEGGNMEYVHHLTLSAGNNDTVCEMAFQNIYAWAPGGGDSVLPAVAGFPFGGEDGHTTLRLEMHYHNPNMDAGEIDNSGIRIEFTRDLREHDAGHLVVGDPILFLNGTQIGDQWSRWDFNCPESCLNQWMSPANAPPGQEIMVFSEFLHMHESGERMVFDHNRNGEVLDSSSIEFYDFRMSGGHFVPKAAFPVKAGDSFDVTCFYKENGKDSTFGLGSSDEMCMAFLYYYPKVKNFHGICGAGMDQLFDPACGGEYSGVDITADEVGRVFGTEGPDCVGPATEQTSPTATNTASASDSSAATTAGSSAGGLVVGLASLVTLFAQF